MNSIKRSKVTIEFQTTSGLTSVETIGPRPDSSCLLSALSAITRTLIENGQGEQALRVVSEEIEDLGPDDEDLDDE